MIRVLLNKEGFYCITNIQDIGMRQQMEAMMGGYGIIRGRKYPDAYSGPETSFKWFQSIFKMYGLKFRFSTIMTSKCFENSLFNAFLDCF